MKNFFSKFLVVLFILALFLLGFFGGFYFNKLSTKKAEQLVFIAQINGYEERCIQYIQSSEHIISDEDYIRFIETRDKYNNSRSLDDFYNFRETISEIIDKYF